LVDLFLQLLLNHLILILIDFTNNLADDISLFIE